ncbi:hypothetical protein AURDEDRAFT_105919 [Auricularia subglabra TFB-10046 SS5]|nr:hypothetical protein AURDEDRAFT_105919 [Auricularia subglabra TFB-10046 SS5]
MVERRPQLVDAVKKLQARKLRVATMCSGTESPLLALDLICGALKDKHGATLDIDHVFSCEIEPFKQAYIERNFHPPIIFRDVCELGGEEATTVYGSKAKVPGNVDILIAGTSCVDYSNLNNEKQDLEGAGESGKTFHGMLDWVVNTRPPLVILENVCSAPWKRVVKKFEDKGYSATFARVDTKNYYIPHTRTRVYLFAVDQRQSSLPEQWLDLVKKMERPASASLDAFLLPSDDPRVTTALAKLVRDSDSSTRAKAHIDWARCENRHHRARTEEELGNKRPLTAWESGGSCKMLDFAWAPWAALQVERVWDLMDISLLRSAYRGVDPSYKTLVWNLSQNVDRTIGAGRLGIAPCLTPSMIPYITNRGGPITGLEALSLQGLPVNNILFTRETEDNLADLAGNAMSTTVVGTCIIAALILGKDYLKPKEEDVTMTEANEDAMDVDKPAELGDNLGAHITGEDQLVERPLDLAVTVECSLATLLVNAHRSRRLCSCEGRSSITLKPLQECTNCGFTSCVACGGRPEHSYQPIDVVAHPRVTPADFAKELKDALPMCLILSGVEEALAAAQPAIDAALAADKGFKERFPAWMDALVKAATGDVRFAGLKRQQIWSALFDSATAQLELVLHPTQPEWRLFGKPKPSTPANSPIRKLLAQPVARFCCKGALFEGVWELSLPHETEISLEVKGTGNLTDSWQRQLGLLGKQFRENTGKTTAVEIKDKVWSSLEVTVPDVDKNVLDRDVSGIYTLHEKCGTASQALHRRVQGVDDGQPGLFFFLDPSRTGDSKDDSFVFSTTHRRYEFGETRPVVAKVNSQWRQNDDEGVQKVACTVSCRWVSAPAMQLKTSAASQALVSLPTKALVAGSASTACESANAILVCQVPLTSGAGPEWGQQEWKEVDKVHERSVFQSLSWCLDRVSRLDEHPREWVEVSSAAECNAECDHCAPRAPAVMWFKKKVKTQSKLVGFEDPGEAGRYEQALKHRPAAFVTQLKVDANGVGVVRIGVNALSLIHRASARLPSIGRTSAKELAYFIDTNFVPAARIDAPKFLLISNKGDLKHPQPPNFKLALRPEQLRSLTWMVTSEDSQYAERQTFIEEEIAEAVLEPLGWRVQGRARRPNTIYGGVLADAVGYGKTAITLGLIDCTASTKPAEVEQDMRGLIKVKATLIIVPPHLGRQWVSEIEKFTGETYKYKLVNSLGDLNRLTIKDIQQLDIIVVATSVLRGDAYLENLADLSAGGSLPRADGRPFSQKLDEIATTRAEQVERLKANDMDGVLAAMRKAKEEEAVRVAAELKAIPSARLKGQKYREQQAANDQTAEEPSFEDVASTPVKKPTRFRPDPNLRMEVVLPSSSPSSGNRSASSSTVASTKGAPSLRKRRSAATRAQNRIVPDSDDEGEGEKDGQEQDDEYQDEPSDGEKPRPVKKRRTRGGAADDSEASAEYTEDEADKEVTPDDDDEQEEAFAAPVRVAKKGARGAKAGKKAAATSSEPEMDTGMDDESNAKPKRGKKRKSTSREDDYDDDEEGEEDSGTPAKKKAKVTKKKVTKAKATKPKATKAQKTKDEEEDSGPRPIEPTVAKKDVKRLADRMEKKLDLAASKKNWRTMAAPPFEMFHFRRIVLDEYTYVEGKVLTMVTGLKATHRWVLSGTPPIHDFSAINSIAAHLDVHLGVDDDGDGSSVKKRRWHQTDVERFHAFREVRTLEWHVHRQQVAQRFLDQFVRQNIAEIDEIPWETHDVIVDLPAAERAIYLELEHQLTAQEMTLKKTKKSESDREKRLSMMIGESKSAEEALLKRAATFDLDEVSKDDALTTCERIVQNRSDQQDECVEDLKAMMLKAHKMKSKLGKADSEQYLSEFLKFLDTKGFGDSEADEIARDCWKEVSSGTYSHRKPKAKAAASTKEKSAKGTTAKKTAAKKPTAKKTTAKKTTAKKTTAKDEIAENEAAEDEAAEDEAAEDEAAEDEAAEDEASEDETVKGKTASKTNKKAKKQGSSTQDDLIWELREHTHNMRRVIKELTGRVRSHRYFKAVRDVQGAGDALSVECPGCGANNLGPSDVSLLSSCGHMGCRKCVRELADKEECVHFASGKCKDSARASNIVPADTLGMDDSVHQGKHFGRKLEMIVDHIENVIPKKERILIFVQFPDLTKKVAAALSENDIGFLEIQGSAHNKSKSLETFQEDGATTRVLLLNVMDESASGANLTCANHAIFISPLLAPSQEIYDACETQAIGRLRRYGQSKKVHIWRFLTRNTMDAEIYESRSGVKLA